MTNLKGARWGPILHGVGSLLIAMIPAVYQLVTTGNPLNLTPDELKWVILAMGIYNAAISAGRNSGAVELNSGTAAAVKGINSSAGSVTVSTLAESAVTVGSAPNLAAGQMVLTVQPAAP